MNTTTTPKQSTQFAAPALPDEDPRSQANIDRRKALKIAERDELGRLLPGSVLERAGRPEGHSITYLARQHTGPALAVLREIVDDPKAPQAARVTAAQALLDRGYGKAPIQIDLTARANFADFLRDVGKVAEAKRVAAIAVAAATIDMADENDGAGED